VQGPEFNPEHCQKKKKKYLGKVKHDDDINNSRKGVYPDTALTSPTAVL
jgi:hypothetical protein